MNDEGKLTKEDIRIMQLEHCIEEFKKYDAKRTKDYSNILIELGQLKSYIQELEDTDKKSAKIINQKREIRRLNEIINSQKLAEIKIDNITLREALQNIEQLKLRNKSLSNENKRFKESINNLIYKLSKYENNKTTNISNND